MVRCNKVDGHPCSCELVEEHIQDFLRRVSVLLMKLILGTITNEEKGRLRMLLRRPNAKEYIELFLMHSDLVRIVQRIH